MKSHRPSKRSPQADDTQASSRPPGVGDNAFAIGQLGECGPEAESELLAGEPLDGGVRSEAEAAYGTSFGDVRLVDTDDPAGEGDANVRAITVGRTIRAAPDVSDTILLHELAHLAQSGPGGTSGGDLQTTGPAEDEADRLAIAARIGTAARATQQVARPHAFSTAEHEAIGDSASGGPETVSINQVDFTMGELDALPDYLKDVDSLFALKRSELTHLRSLLESERIKPGSVAAERWEAAPGDYLEVSQNNEDHFAPTDTAVAPDAGGPDNQGTWEAYYRSALAEAQSAATAEGSEKDEHTARAWATLAFAEHYLEDAYSAGHQFNKKDVSASAKSGLDALTDADEDALFLRVAQRVYDQRSDMIDRYQVSYDVTTAVDGTSWFDMNADRWGKFVLRVKDTRQNLVLNGLALGLHDQMGASGIDAQREGDASPLALKGDTHLDDNRLQPIADAISTARKPVRDVLAGGKVDADASIVELKKLFPKPTPDADIAGIVHGGLDPSAGLEDSLVEAMLPHVATILTQAATEAPNEIKLREGIDAPTDAPIAEAGVSATKRTPPAPESWYVVQRGDTLWDIARAQYGDPQQWHAIYEANRDRLPPPGDEAVLQPGWKLRIPEVEGQ